MKKEKMKEREWKKEMFLLYFFYITQNKTRSIFEKKFKLNFVFQFIFQKIKKAIREWLLEHL